jgi:hypothetical protein
MIMGWHYAAKEFKIGDETYYGIVEVFPDIQSTTDIPVHTEKEVSITADSLEELSKWLRIAADDVYKYPVIKRD